MARRSLLLQPAPSPPKNRVLVLPVKTLDDSAIRSLRSLRHNAVRGSDGAATQSSRSSLESGRSVETRLRRYLSGLRECGSWKDLERGRSIHREAIASGDERNAYLVTSLINMYAKCGKLSIAREIFDKALPQNHQDVALWTALITGYVDNGLEDQALELLFRMRCLPNARAFVAALKACANLAAREGDGGGNHVSKSTCLERGRELQARAAAFGFDSSDVFVGNTMVDMFAKCGSMAESRRAFEKILVPDTVSWNALVLGYAANRQENVALEIFSRFLRSSSCRPDAFSFLAALKACSSLATREIAKPLEKKPVKAVALEKGMALHGEAVKRGLASSLVVSSSLIDMFSNCGSMADARRVYDKIDSHNVVLWTALMNGYAENGEEEVALDLFSLGRPRSCKPNARSFLAALKACAGLAAKEQGRQATDTNKLVKMESLEKGMAVHSEALKTSCCDIFLTTTLVVMYAKCGTMADARRAFDLIHKRNVVLWTALISGYVDNGEAQATLELFEPMRREGLHPNAGFFAAALKACADEARVETGKAFHADICRSGLESDAIVGSGLVDLYAKCGMASEAQQVFDSLPDRNLATWTSLLTGYSRVGETEQVFHVWDKMRDDGVPADSVTFVCLLSACSHAGLVDRGIRLLRSMSAFGVDIGVEHYVCMADLVDRATEVKDAGELANKTMPLRRSWIHLPSGRLWWC